MMKKAITLFFISLTAIAVHAQSYRFTFNLQQTQDTVMYLGQHFRDKFVILDTAMVKANSVTFRGNRMWKRGVYALVDQTRQKGVKDFVVDGSQQITFTTKSDGTTKVKGCPSNQAMWQYIDHETAARKKAKDLNSRLQSADSTQAHVQLDRLNKEMAEWENATIEHNKQFLYFQLLQQFNGPSVPDEVADKSYYYRQHYWDAVDLTDHSLIYTPDLFNKMNYYFFGILYHSDADTICAYADRILHRIQDDSIMMNYVMEYIMPRYYRSTKNIGWDATWCHLVREYYLKGKCPWATQGDLINKQKTAAFLEKSLIGARGAELWMADTNQSPDPSKWKSSHRVNYPYVILWFWDPDCHHCQEQTASLKILYDSLSIAGTRPFEVYAVGYESDVEKWKRYVRKHELPFLNVGGPNVNIDYQEAYNVHGAPTMIILNHKREIIMNKNLPTEAIMTFLREYEKKNNLHFIKY